MHKSTEEKNLSQANFYGDNISNGILSFILYKLSLSLCLLLSVHVQIFTWFPELGQIPEWYRRFAYIAPDETG
jgi:hypothetical protein